MSIFFLVDFRNLARIIRTDPGNSSSIVTARVDFGGSHIRFVKFRPCMGVPSEKMHFQHPEPPKIPFFSTSAEFFDPFLLPDVQRIE